MSKYDLEVYQLNLDLFNLFKKLYAIEKERNIKEVNEMTYVTSNDSAFSRYCSFMSYYYKYSGILSMTSESEEETDFLNMFRTCIGSHFFFGGEDGKEYLVTNFEKHYQNSELIQNFFKGFILTFGSTSDVNYIRENYPNFIYY